jgi:ComF family protein
VIGSITELFYPALCTGCENTLFKGELELCTACILDLPYTRMHDQEANIIEQRLAGRFSFEAATSLLFFHKSGKVQHMLHALKYKNNQAIGKLLGAMLADELMRSKRFAEIDFIVPVPIHPKKGKIRGYNQAEVIAEGMVERGFFVRAHALKKTEHRESQTRSGIYARYKNVADIFGLGDTTGLECKKVLLLDDVLTTGATLEACAKLLMKIDGLKVYIATLACTEH